MIRTSLRMAAVLAVAAGAAKADLVYSQNFDSMVTGTAAPVGWSEFSLSGSHDDFRMAGSTAAITTTVLPSDGVSFIRNGPAGTSTLTNNATLVVGTPTNQRNAAGFNFGLAASPTDRALGTSPTGVSACELQLSLVNTDPNSLNAITISYDIRRFSTTAVNNSGYIGADVGLEELPGYWLFYSQDGGTTWTNVSALNPTKAGPGGVIVPNSVGVTNVPSTSFNLGSAWAPGSTILLRWFDDNAQSPSPDQLIGLDNVSITAVPGPGALACIGFGFLTTFRRRR